MEAYTHSKTLATVSVQPNKPVTKWFGWVRTSHDGRDGVAVTAGGDTLAECLTDAFRQASYYLLCCGYSVRISDIQEECVACNGTGSEIIVRKRAPAKTKRCVACRGKGVYATLDEFPVRLHPNAIDDLRNGAGLILAEVQS